MRMDSLPWEGDDSLRQDDSNNHSVETKSLGKNENKDHTDEDLLLLCVSSDSRITHDSNSETSSLKSIRTLRKLRGRRDHSKVRRRDACIPYRRSNQRWRLFNKLDIFNRLTFALENDGNDESIDTQDTSHNNWYNWLEDKFWLENTHAWNTNSTLSSSVGCTQVW